MRHLLVGVVLGLAASLGIVLAGAQDSTVNVELNEWDLIPDVSSVSAGDIQFVAANTGAIVHELSILKTDLPPDALPVIEEEAIVDKQAVGLEGRIDVFAPGSTEAGTFSLAPGRYVLICNVPGHYQAGMYAGFTVTEPVPTAEPTSTAPASPSPTASPTAPAAGLVGDVNCSGTIDAIDAALILQFGAGIVGSLPCQQDADPSADGLINAIDAALILQFDAGLIDSLAASGPGTSPRDASKDSALSLSGAWKRSTPPLQSSAPYRSTRSGATVSLSRTEERQ